MPSVVLQNVSVEFPVYGAGAGHSLKARLLKLGVNGIVGVTEKVGLVGGRIGIGSDKVIHVQALTDISLSLKDGDRVGLIGHNGAGKSTLLRVLSGVYEPCRGIKKMSGHVSPLFEILLGMDPEGSGRENILLRGIYLGLSPSQIRRKIDEIAEFAELGDYLGMPLRTYSTGMKARLAFAISTSLEPDILLFDESFNVGDSGFMAKAERRLKEFVGRAGIVVLASHVDDLVRSICNKGLLLEHGRAVMFGGVEEVLEYYHANRNAAQRTTTAV